MSADPSVLMIAFHFPPCAISSGLQRTLYFVRHISNHTCFRPIVLSASPESYERRSDEQLDEIPHDVEVIRTFAPDATRHLSLKGKHLESLARPDRWQFWRWTSLPMAISAIRRRRVKALWSTYPIATAHVLAYRLSRLMKLPWIADFRDPMVEFSKETQKWYPLDARLRQARLRIEGDTLNHASYLTVCTETSKKILEERYPQVPKERIILVPNGFDETVVGNLPVGDNHGAPSERRLHIVHSGTIYGGATRDAAEFLDALRTLVENGRLISGLQVTLRGTGNDNYYQQMIRDRGLESYVHTKPPISHKAALQEMMTADGLLLLQGRASNSAIPAKAYEYIATKRPIFAIVGKDGDTARELRSYPLAQIADVSNVQDIPARLADFIDVLDRNEIPPVSDTEVMRFSRRHGAERLVDVLENVI